MMAEPGRWRWRTDSSCHAKAEKRNAEELVSTNMVQVLSARCAEDAEHVLDQQVPLNVLSV